MNSHISSQNIVTGQGVVRANSKRYDPLALLRQLSREDPSERVAAPPSATLAPRPSLESRMSSI